MEITRNVEGKESIHKKLDTELNLQWGEVNGNGKINA